jgi:glucose/mannose-6-phosphate isomerase
MGGSGVAGDVLRSLFSSRLPLPIVVVKGFDLPEFCGRDTLVIASSFSGNTAETLAAFEEAVVRGCRIVTVSSGGRLEERSGAEGVPHVDLPRGVPVPRAGLGYLSAAPIGVLDAMGLIPSAADDVARGASLLDGLADALAPDRATEANEAKAVADWLVGRTPIIWGSEGLAEAATLRWKTQLNENAKLPAFHSIIPELDHNEVEGWSEGAGASYGVVILRHGEEPAVLGPRVEATLEAVRGAGLETRQVVGIGATPMEILFSLIMLGDFTSTYLGLVRGVDPTPVPVLTGIKERLRE